MAGRVLISFAVLLVAACRAAGAGPTCTAQIDWVDFIQIGSVQYVAEPGSSTSLQEADLGPVVAHVKAKLSGNVCNPDYRPKDGDAGVLEPGTPIYRVSGYPTSVRLAAHRDGRIQTYRAMAPQYTPPP